MAPSLRVDHKVAHVPYGGASNDLAEAYHEDSKYTPYRLPRLLRGFHRYQDWLESQPFEVVPGKQSGGPACVPLPKPSRLRPSLATALARRSSRPPHGGSLTLKETATLLHAGIGIRADGHRNTPSAGALYPLEAYVVAPRHLGPLDAGMACHYDPYRHALSPVRAEVDPSTWLLDPGPFRDASVFLVITAMTQRSRVKYCERSYRFVLLEAGHAMQNVQLAAAAMRRASVPLGGYFDDRVHDSLGLDGVEEIALYVAALGR